MMKLQTVMILFMLMLPNIGIGCSMYKITKDGKTIVGNNEDWLSPNSQFWFEQGVDKQYGVMYMGLLNNFAQGAINEAGLVFDGFANPYLEIKNIEGKEDIPIADAVRKVMQTMRTVEEVKAYFETINLSVLTSSQLVFVDRSGTYLIIEGDALIVGEETEKAFSNFYYSQVKSEEEVSLPNFKSGLKFLNASEGAATKSYCSDVMKSLASHKVFGTQYTTIYDLSTLKIRIHLFQDYTQFVELDLKEELQKGNNKLMIAHLFSKETVGRKHYEKYNDSNDPVKFLKEMLATVPEQPSERELQAMGMNGIINTIGYEWLNDKNDTKAAIKTFTYGVTLMPTDADLYDSLGEAYFKDKNYAAARTNYKKSLQLNPENENAKDYLKKMADK